MSRFDRSMPSGYFDDLYARDADPWRFATSNYEREKYAATLAAFPRVQYQSALEVGCSIGVFTRQLASRAEALLAIDVAAKALDEARQRCADLQHVRFDLMSVPAQWPYGTFDLIMLSEVVYYLDKTDVAALAARIRDCITPGGDIVLVHWLGETNYPLTGDEAVELFTASVSGWAVRVSGAKYAGYRLDLFRAEDTS